MDSGKRIINYLLMVGLCGFVKGLDKELERDSLMGIGNIGTAIYIEKRSDFLHTKISKGQLLVGIVNLDEWITNFRSMQKSNLDMVMANTLRNQYTSLTRKLETIVGRKRDREKRSLEFIGNLWSDLFGNPGPEDWRPNNANILALKQAI
jgi:hypothetical protein